MADSSGESIFEVEGEERFWSVTPEWCRDITDDADPELGFYEFTGGAHCCFRLNVVSLESVAQEGRPARVRIRRLLRAWLGNYGGSYLRQLDDSPALEITGDSDVFAYFDDPSYAESPSLPLVLSYNGRRFVERSEDFREFVHASVQDQLAILEQARRQDDAAREPAPKMAALVEFGRSLIFGEDNREALERVKSRYPTMVDTWLDEYASDAVARFRRYYFPSFFEDSRCPGICPGTMNSGPELWQSRD